jgi:hypothetical protein
MIKKNHLLLLTFSLLFIAFQACKEDDNGNPVIYLNQGAGLTTGDTLVKFGDTITVSIEAKSNGIDLLTGFELIGNGQSVADSTFSLAQFNVSYKFIKSFAAQDTWTFKISDKAGNIDSLSVVISRSTGITTIASVKLGAQDNTAFGSFYSVSNNTVYFQGDAFNNQNKIDLFCFYEGSGATDNNMSLAAPGTGITGIFTGSTSPDNYTIKNYSFFVKTSLTAANFDAINSDVEILANFDTDNDYKKAKQLNVGDVYCVKLNNGKYGIFKVLSVEGTESGSLEFAMKVQQ